MNKIKIVLPLLLAGLFSLTASAAPSSSGKPCNDVSIYQAGRFDAIEKIQNTDFDFIQEFSTLNLMGIRKATFYSCNSGNGFLIVDRGGRQPELFRNVPRELWEDWKISYHIDFFYNRFIRNNTLFL